MKKILEFNLPEDDDEFHLANNALVFATAVTEAYEYVRGQLKYNDLSGADAEHMERVKEILLDAYNLCMEGK